MNLHFILSQIPPTFTTPGARQLPRKLPGRQPPPRPPTFSPSEDSGLDSPAPPTLTTPGVKQLYRPDRGLGVKIENRLGMESGETSNDNSPAYPTFNTPVLNKVKIIFSYKYIISLIMFLYKYIIFMGLVLPVLIKA